MEGPLFPNMPEHPMAEEAATLLLVKYCLFGGNVVAESKLSNHIRSVKIKIIRHKFQYQGSAKHMVRPFTEHNKHVQFRSKLENKPPRIMHREIHMTLPGRGNIFRDGRISWELPNYEPN